MRQAWLRCFEERQPVATEDAADATPAYDTLTAESSVNELELSTKVASTLDRAGIYTVGDLLAIDPVALNRMRGVGKVTIGEIRELLATLRATMGESPEPAPAPALDGPPSVDRLLRDILATADTDRDHAIVEAHLGLHPNVLGQLPNQAQVARVVKNQPGHSQSNADRTASGVGSTAIDSRTS